MCNCRKNNRKACRELIERGLITCCEGLAECQAGLDAVQANNVTRGLREIRTGECLCQQGINCCQRGIVRGGFQNRNTCSGLRECKQALCDMNFGCCEIKNNNVSDGIDDVAESICACEEGLNKIRLGLIDRDNTVSSCQTASTSSSTSPNSNLNGCDMRTPPFYSAKPRLIA